MIGGNQRDVIESSDRLFLIDRRGIHDAGRRIRKLVGFSLAFHAWDRKVDWLIRLYSLDGSVVRTRSWTGGYLSAQRGMKLPFLCHFDSGDPFS